MTTRHPLRRLVDTPYAHGDVAVWRGDWYHVWCSCRDRSRDRIRDSFLAPVEYGADGSLRTLVP